MAAHTPAAAKGRSIPLSLLAHRTKLAFRPFMLQTLKDVQVRYYSCYLGCRWRYLKNNLLLSGRETSQPISALSFTTSHLCFSNVPYQSEPIRNSASKREEPRFTMFIEVIISTLNISMPPTLLIWLPSPDQIATTAPN